VDKIKLEDKDGQHIVYDKGIIEQEIMKANENKLLQASNTPLRSDELSVLLGEQGDYSKWEEVLNGYVTLPHNMDEGLQTWCDYITKQESYNINDITWTTKEYCDSWAKINENKSTLPGIQVAHMKSLEAESEAADRQPINKHTKHCNS
jgi:hypothetical protein